MSKFKELQDQHVRLLERHEKHKESPELLKEVREYTEQVINASREISDSRERNQLRANLRFWGSYIYDRTGTYPNLSLLPSEAKTETPSPETQAKNITWIVTFSLVLLIAIFLARLFLVNQYPPNTLSGEMSPVQLTVQVVNATTTFNTVGQVINYTYVVTNTGNIHLAGPVNITDDKVAVTCPGVETVGNNNNFLDQGEILTCTGTYSITRADLNAGSVTNIATANVGGIASAIASTVVRLATLDMLAQDTAQALLTQPAINPATATLGAAFTQIAVSTATAIPLPSTDTEGGILGHANSSTEIRDDDACSSHRVNIIMVHDFASDRAVEPATLTISEEGTFRKIVEKQVSLNDGRELSDGAKEINTEITISNPSGSYLIYVDHPKFTFDTVIIQHLPDCHGNLNDITYDLPTDDYDELESRPSLGMNFGLIVWGPYPAIEPESIAEGVAKIHVSNTGSVAGNIFWISEKFGDFEPLQNDEFIAYSSINYLIGVTSGGRTISIPFRFETPYLDYLRNK
jgi:hypothetical protein